jgi:hypothetical protein
MNNIIDGLIDWMRKDYIIIVICLLSLAACLITIVSIDAYQEKINDAWMDQWQQSGCIIEPEYINITYNIGGDYYGIKDID